LSECPYAHGAGANARVAVMYENRHHFRESLRELERQTLGGLDMVLGQLDHVLESVSGDNVELADLVAADDDRIDGRYLEVHQGLLSLLAREAPVAGDLRIVVALLVVIRCMERMGDQCVNIAKLVRLSDQDAPKDGDMLATIERMGRLARSQVAQAKQAFTTRHVALAQHLIGLGGEVNRLNREIHYRAVEVGEAVAVREWAMCMILVARCLERVAGNATDIAEQTIFVVTGRLGEAGGGSA